MHKPPGVVALPLLKSKTEIVERCLINIKTRVIGSQYSNLLRRKIKDLSKLRFALPDLVFSLLCCGDVCNSAHIFQVARGTLQRASQNVEVLHRTIRHQQPMLTIKIFPLVACAVDSLLSEISVVGMNSLEY